MKFCIICRKPFTEKNPATKEHIIPEAIGGNFVIDTVCKDCNSNMGTKIDAPFVKNIISRLHIEENQIKGKKGIVEFPLKGDYQDEIGNKYRIDNLDSDPVLLDDRPEITIEKLESGEYSVSISFEKFGTFSENDINKLFAKYEKYLEREFNKQELLFDREKLLSSEFIRTIKPSMRLQKREQVDFNPFFLEALKIAYEFFVTHYPKEMEHKDIKNIAYILENADFNMAKKYVSLHIPDEKIEYITLTKLLKEKFGSVFIINPLKTPDNETGYFISLYEKFIFLVKLSNDDLFGNTTYLPYIYILEQKKVLYELQPNELIQFQECLSLTLCKK